MENRDWCWHVPQALRFLPAQEPGPQLRPSDAHTSMSLFKCVFFCFVFLQSTNIRHFGNVRYVMFIYIFQHDTTSQKFLKSKNLCFCKEFGNTLLEGVCIRLTWHLHNHDMTHVMNMKEILCMFMTTVIMYHCLNVSTTDIVWDVFVMTTWHKPTHHNLSVSLSWQLDITKTT